MKWFQLCKGEGLDLCSTCKRNEAKHPKDAANPMQAYLTPHPQQNKSGDMTCPDWMAPDTGAYGR